MAPQQLSGPNGQSIEPIAICGMAMRLPGGIKTSEAYWDALLNGRDMRKPIPLSRYNVKGFNDSMGKTNAVRQQHGYFLEDDLAAFDAGLFTMTRTELEKADPQQRLLLLVVRECLESAGVTDYRGSLTGFFVGTFGEDWLQTQSKEEQHPAGYVLTGHLDPMLANRVAFEYDFRGPCFVVKTACSSSMIALHNAVRSVQNRDCEAAIVSGTNLNMTPITTAAMTQEGIMSPEGSCKTFDARADGYARGEAINAVYIKPLSHAIRDGNPIRAVIRNTGINNDGQSTGLFATSIVAQEALMKKTYADAGIEPSETALVECHGTGTPLGDPVEAISVANVFAEPNGIYIGSVKPNLGHAEGAAGISSLIKAVLSLEHKKIPPNIKFELPNPQIPFHDKNLVVPVQLMPWPEGKASRVSVNSFGIGGTNAHCIVESAEQYFQNLSHSRLGTELAVVSANSQASLIRRIENIQQYISDNPEKVPDLCYTLSQRREHFKWRSHAVISGTNGASFTRPIKKPVKAPSIVMVFSGQGAQWPQMGHDLLMCMPEFKQDLLAMDEILQSLDESRPEWRVIDEISKPVSSSQMARAELAQPLSTILQIGIVNVLKRFGIQPHAVVGHSSGEIAAAYAAGALTLRQAVIAAYYRGHITKRPGIAGGMAAIGLGAAKTETYLPERVVVACENSPTSTTISGDADQLQVALAAIRQAQPDVFVKTLKVEMAYHSHLMLPLARSYRACLEDEFDNFACFHSLDGVPNQMRIPLFSSVRAQIMTDRHEFDGQYWADNLTSPVRFRSAIESVLQDVADPVFIEIGPHSTLQGPIRETCSNKTARFDYVSTMLRGRSCTQSLLSAIGQLHQLDAKVDFSVLYPKGKVLTDLPAYPWSLSERYWYEPRLSRDWRLRPYGQHELLGRRVAESTSLNPSWRLVLTLDHVPWLLDHKIQENVVLPFTGYLSIVGEAIRQLTGIETGYKIKKAKVHKALVLQECEISEVVTALWPQRDSRYFEFNISSHDGSEWVTHCDGLVRAVDQVVPESGETVELPRKADTTRWFQTLARSGLNYGPSFRLLDDISAATSSETATACIKTGKESMDGPFLFHPTTMDACVQLAIVAGAKGLPRNLSGVPIPTEIDELEVYKGADEMRAWACPSDDGCATDVECVADEHSLLKIRGLRFMHLPGEDAQADESANGAYLEWVPDFDFQDDAATLVKPPSDDAGTCLLEEFTLLCILDSVERIKHRTACSAHLQRYGEWMAQEAELFYSGYSPVITDVQQLTSLSSKERAESISEKYSKLVQIPCRASYAVAIEKIRSNIEALYVGDIGAAQLLMDNSVLPDVYDNINFDYAEYIKLMSNSRPALRILEVGAGAGGTTDKIMSQIVQDGTLPPYSTYTYTDISPGFFPQARERFADKPNIEYKVFDISKNPLSQGFEPNSYDIIIAPYVVHATPYLRQTLRNLGVVLKQNGKLLLSEPAAIGKSPNYIFGVFSSWWSGQCDGRMWEPWVSINRWHRELKIAGFTGVERVVYDAPMPYRYWSTIVAKLDGPKSCERPAPVTLLCTDTESESSRDLAQGLERAGYSTSKKRLGQKISDEDNLVVSLDLEDPFFHNISPENWRSFQSLIETSAHPPNRKILWLLPCAQKNVRDARSALSLGVLRSLRTEFGLSLTTLEIDSTKSDVPSIVSRLYNKTYHESTVEPMLPDREYLFEDETIKVGRYRPFAISSELSSKIDETGDKIQPTLKSNQVVMQPSKPKAGCTIHNSPEFDGTASYIVTGGLGGLGRAICSWMAEHGARFLTVISRSAGKSDADQDFIDEMQAADCVLTPYVGCVQDYSSVEAAIKNSPRPVKGVIHLAMVLRDALFSDITHDQWREGLSAKVDGAWNIHKALLGTPLDFFIVTSSIASTINVPGQASYNAANTYLEAFCQYRNGLGLAASAIAVSPIDDIGVVVGNSKARRSLQANGLQFLDEKQVLNYVHLAMLHRGPTPIVMGLHSDKHLDDSDNNVAWKYDRRMGFYHNIPKQQSVQSDSSSEHCLSNFLTVMTRNPIELDTRESEEFLALEIGRRVYSYMLKPAEEVDISLSLVDVGLDSLMAVEMRRIWIQMFGTTISIMEIMSLGALTNFGRFAAQSLKKQLLVL